MEAKTLKKIVEIYEVVKGCEKKVTTDYDTYERGATGYEARTVVQLIENGQEVGAISMRKSCNAEGAVGPDFETWVEHTDRDYKSDNSVIYRDQVWNLEFSDVVHILNLCGITTAWHKKCG